MLSNFTIQKIKDEPNAVNDLIYYGETTIDSEAPVDKLSQFIDNAYINGTVVYKGELEDIDFIDYFNEQMGTNYTTLDEIYNNESIDIIEGIEVYAIIG